MTPLERQSNIMHGDAMQSKDYACTHVTGFNGPGYLNINAMQNDTKELKEDKIFRPTKYYDVYDTTELEMQAPVMPHVTDAEIIRKYPSIEGLIIKQISYTDVMYVFECAEDVVKCVGKQEIARRFGPHMVDKVDVAINTGTAAYGWWPHKVYLEFDMNDEIVGGVAV